MPRAYLVLDFSCGFDDFMLHKSRVFVVRLEVSFAVRGKTGQAGLDSFVLLPSAKVAQHPCMFRFAVAER